MQKTFRQDFINRKAIKNTGQLPMYLIENHHEGIVSRESMMPYRRRWHGGMQQRVLLKRSHRDGILRQQVCALRAAGLR